MQHPVCDHLGPGVGRSGGHPLAAHVGDRVDAGVAARDHLGVIGIQPGERRDRLRLIERLLAFGGIGSRVGEENATWCVPATNCWMFCSDADVSAAVAFSFPPLALLIASAKPRRDCSRRRWCFRSRCSSARRIRPCRSSARAASAAVTTSLTTTPGQYQQHSAGNHRQCDPPHVIMMTVTAAFQTRFRESVRPFPSRGHLDEGKGGLRVGQRPDVSDVRIELARPYLFREFGEHGGAPVTHELKPAQLLANGLSATDVRRDRSSRSAAIARRGSPPTMSRTASTPSGAATRTRSSTAAPYATGIPPKRATSSCLAGLATPITRSPRAVADCTAGTPTPPPAPLTNNVDPSTSPKRLRASNAVAAATGSTAAISGLTLSGRRAVNEAVVKACSAQPPTIPGQPPKTSSPMENWETPGPSATTVPATSRPSTVGPLWPYEPSRTRQSPGLTPAARTRTRSSSVPGSGTGTSRNACLSGPPIWVNP